MTLKEMIERALQVVNDKLEERKKLSAEIQEFRGKLEGDTEVSRADVDKVIAARDALDEELEEAESQLKELRAEQARDDAAARLAEAYPIEERGHEPRALVKSPDVYERGSEQSFLRDLFRGNHRNDQDALERLRTNNAQMAERAIGTTATAGGELSPPSWMVDEYEKLARSARVVADLLNKQPLPAGVSSIPVPKITSGTSVAEQSTQGSALSETDMVTSSVDAKVGTVGGLQTVNLQLLDQSPINIDNLVFDELAAAHGEALDALVINGNIADRKGLLNATGTNSVSYVDSTPTFGEFWPKLVNAELLVKQNRKRPVTAIAMKPRRWAWLQTQLDGAGNPMVLDALSAAHPSFAQSEGSIPEGFVGVIRGSMLPVYVDENIPGNLNTDQDAVLVFRPEDIPLYESDLRAESFTETKAKELQVVFRLFSYYTIAAERSPKSISKITGTGLAAPSF